MNLDTEEEGTNSISPSEFDKFRMKDLEIGDEMTQEYGNWKCIKYKNDQWVLLLYNHSKLKPYNEFRTLKQLILFLENN